MQTLTLSALSLAALATCALWMQDSKPQRFTHPISKDKDGGMARWMETTKPGPAHERLKELLGTYEVKMSILGMPGEAAMESKGTSEVSWLAEGKWLQMKWSVPMFGHAVTGAELLGYDNFKQRYVWCQVNSLETAMKTASGHFDKSGDNLILWGQIDEPATPEQDKEVRYIWRGFGQDKCTIEVHDMMIGETDTKVVTFEFTRKK